MSSMLITAVILAMAISNGDKCDASPKDVKLAHTFMRLNTPVMRQQAQDCLSAMGTDSRCVHELLTPEELKFIGDNSNYLQAMANRIGLPQLKKRGLSIGFADFSNESPLVFALLLPMRLFLTIFLWIPLYAFVSVCYLLAEVSYRDRRE